MFSGLLDKLSALFGVVEHLGVVEHPVFVRLEGDINDKTKSYDLLARTSEHKELIEKSFKLFICSDSTAC